MSRLSKLRKNPKAFLVDALIKNPLRFITVTLPVILALLYFGLIASDQYVSQSSFVIRSASSQNSLTGLGAFLQNVGFSRSQDDTYSVREYITSRAALNNLEQQGIAVRSFYEKKGDLFSRFNAFGLYGENEVFYQYYKKKVAVQFDPVSGISTLDVAAFEPQDALQVNEALLKQAEALINQLNDRALKDTVKYAQAQVDIAEERVKKAAEDLIVYRTHNGVFDLKVQAEGKINLISKLQDELILLQTQLDQVRAITPDNPQISGLMARERSLKKEIEKQTNAMLSDEDGSMTKQAAEYQRVYLENELAEKQLAAAITALESAKADATRQQLYLEVISAPVEPDFALLPRRLYNIIATLFIGLMIYGVAVLLLAGVREHKN